MSRNINNMKQKHKPGNCVREGGRKGRGRGGEREKGTETQGEEIHKTRVGAVGQAEKGQRGREGKLPCLVFVNDSQG